MTGDGAFACQNSSMWLSGSTAVEAEATFAASKELWLSWAESITKDETLKKALRTPCLRQHLQPSIIWTSTQPAKRLNGRRQGINSRFVRQMLYGCILERNCHSAFCLTSKAFKARGLSRLQIDLLASELTNRALEYPFCERYQPHSEQHIRSGSKRKSTSTASQDSSKISNTRSQPFLNVFVGHIQRLVGFKNVDSAQQKQQPKKDINRHSLTNGLTPEANDAASNTTHKSLVPEALAGNNKYTNGVSPAVKSVISSATQLSDITTNTEKLTAAQQQQQLSKKLPDCLLECDETNNPVMAITILDSENSTLVANTGGKLLRNTLSAVFTSAKLLSQCFVLEGCHLPLNMDTSNALGFFHSVFGFQMDADTVSLADGLALMKPVCRSLDRCLSAIEHLLNQRCSALSASDRQALLRHSNAQRRIRGLKLASKKKRSYYNDPEDAYGDGIAADTGSGDGNSTASWLESISHALAIIALFLATASTQRCAAGCGAIETTGVSVPYSKSIRSLQRRASHLIVKVIYGPLAGSRPDAGQNNRSYVDSRQHGFGSFAHARNAASDDLDNVDEDIDSSVSDMHPPGSSSGWHATFAQDTWLRDEWLRWWAMLPADIVKTWVNVLKEDAYIALAHLNSGITSDRVVSSLLTEDPIEWAGSLELLRILSDSNSQLCNHMLDFHHRLPAPTTTTSAAVDGDGDGDGDGGDGDSGTNVIGAEEFNCNSILDCFDLKYELHRWMDYLRFLADPKKEYNLTKDRWAEENIFSPYHYPFLFTTEDKLELHKIEVHARMKTRYLSSHDRQAEIVQNQRVLNIDAHSEQLVRANFLPEWPLLTSNRLAVASASNPYIVMAMRRDRLIQDAMDMLDRNLNRLKFPLKVRFVATGEDGVDMGGVQKEFFALLLPQLLSPERGLFVFTNNDGGYLWPNAGTPHSLKDFELVGVILGLAFNNGIVLDSSIAPLAPLLLSQLACGHPGLDNTSAWPLKTLVGRVKGTFPELVSGLEQLLDWDEEEQGVSVEDAFCRSFDVTVPDPLHIWKLRRNATYFGAMIAGSSDVMMTMALDQYSSDSDSSCSNADDDDSGSKNNSGGSRSAEGHRGQPMLNAPYSHLPVPSPNETAQLSDAITFPLIRDGSSIEVTKDNRELYVRRYLEFIGYEHAQAQISAIRKGFVRVADGIIYRMTDRSELQYWLNPENSKIDVDELRKIATYDDEYTDTHKVVVWFWNIVKGFSQEQLKQLLAFVTASDSIPFGGYKNITFVIQRNGPDTMRLPTALTCFGRLLLPAYSSEDKLRERLLVAIENTSGFGLV